MGDIIKSKTRYDFMDYKALFDMTGKVCVITGGSGYLGSGNLQAVFYGAWGIGGSGWRFCCSGGVLL